MDPTLKHAARITAFMARNIFLKSNPLFKSDSYIVVKWKTSPLTLEMLSQERPTQQDGGFNHQSVRRRSGLLSHSGFNETHSLSSEAPQVLREEEKLNELNPGSIIETLYP